MVSPSKASPLQRSGPVLTIYLSPGRPGARGAQQQRRDELGAAESDSRLPRRPGEAATVEFSRMNAVMANITCLAFAHHDVLFLPRLSVKGLEFRV
jgi:hypothetical protein